MWNMNWRLGLDRFGFTSFAAGFTFQGLGFTV